MCTWLQHPLAVHRLRWKSRHTLGALCEEPWNTPRVNIVMAYLGIERTTLSRGSCTMNTLSGFKLANLTESALNHFSKSRFLAHSHAGSMCTWLHQRRHLHWCGSSEYNPQLVGAWPQLVLIWLHAPWPKARIRRLRVSGSTYKPRVKDIYVMGTSITYFS